MQKKIIALAVAGLVSGVAFAQSNVTVYGSADMSYNYAKGGNVAGAADKKYSGMNGGEWNGNRVGFRGEEGLGNGLKAIFTYEFGSALESQGGLTKLRQGFVGLDTPFGAVTLGRQYAPSGVIAGRNSAVDNAATAALNNMWQVLGTGSTPLLFSTMGNADQSRWNNSIAWVSKDYSGFSARAIYAFSNTVGGIAVPASASSVEAYETKTSDNGKLGLSASYANGPFNVDLIYQAQYNVRFIAPGAGVLAFGNGLTPVSVTTPLAIVPTAYSGDGSDINEWFLGGAYDFKFVKLFGTYQQLRNSNNSVLPAAANSDFNMWSVGASVPVSAAGKIRAEYAKVSFDGNNAAATYIGSSTGYTLAYTHDLSKRTLLYTLVTRMDNDSDSAGIGPNGVSVGVAGEKNTVFTAGVRHFF